MSEKKLGKGLKRKPQRIIVVTCVCIALLCAGMVTMISRYPAANPVDQLEGHELPTLSKKSLVTRNAAALSEVQESGGQGLLVMEQGESALDEASDTSLDASEDVSLIPECPVQTGNTRFVHYEHNALGSSWKYLSDENLDSTVASVLDCLKGDGWSLMESQTLDLFGDFWGCIAQRDESVVMVVAGREEIALAEGNKGAVQLTVVEMNAS